MQVVDDVIRIVKILFPGHPIRIYVFLGTAQRAHHLWAEDGQRDLRDALLDADFLDCIDLEPERPAELLSWKTISVTVPKTVHSAPDEWWPLGRLERWINDRAPVACEQVRYFTKQWRYRKDAASHSWKPLDRAAAPPSLSVDASRHDVVPTVLFCLHWMETGGAESFAFDCISWARRKGARAIILTDWRGDHDHFELSGDDVLFYPCYYLDENLYSQFVLQLVRKHNVSFVHIHHSSKMYAALPLVRFYFPSLSVIDSTHIQEHADGGFVRISGVWSKYIDHSHVISAQLLEILNTIGRNQQGIVLGYLYGDGFRKTPEFNVLKDGRTYFHIAFVGRMAEQKRPLLFIATIRALLSRKISGVKIRITVAGDGEYLAYAKCLADIQGVGNQITFIGRTKSPKQLMKDCDLVIIPSANEGLTLVAYEAFECGALIVTPRVGAQHELIPADLLGPVDPRGFVNFAARTARRLIVDKPFRARAVAEFKRKAAQIAAQPSAEVAVGDLYDRLLETTSANSGIKQDA